MSKLDKILESMDSFRINSEVALLESEGLDALTIAQTKKTIHESFAFIKGELIQGGVLEETQNLLANAWTQAIMEDIHVPFMPEDDGFGAGDAAALAGAGGVAAGGAYLGPQMAKNYNASRGLGYSVGSSAGAAMDMAGQKVANDYSNARSNVVGGVNNVRNQAGQAMDNLGRDVQLGTLKAGIVGRNAVNQAGQYVADQATAAKQGIVNAVRAATPDAILAKVAPTKVQTPATANAQLALPAKSTVRRVGPKA